MTRARYAVTEGAAFDSGGERVRVFSVHRAPYAPGVRGHDVWYSDGKARCTGCYGPLVSMLTTCPHARAVARKIKNG